MHDQHDRTFALALSVGLLCLTGCTQLHTATR